MINFTIAAIMKYVVLQMQMPQLDLYVVQTYIRLFFMITRNDLMLYSYCLIYVHKIINLEMQYFDIMKNSQYDIAIVWSNNYDYSDVHHKNFS